MRFTFNNARPHETIMPRTGVVMCPDGQSGVTHSTPAHRDTGARQCHTTGSPHTHHDNCRTRRQTAPLGPLSHDARPTGDAGHPVVRVVGRKLSRAMRPPPSRKHERVGANHHRGPGDLARPNDDHRRRSVAVRNIIGVSQLLPSSGSVCRAAAVTSAMNWALPVRYGSRAFGSPPCRSASPFLRAA
jgi:hypothetical protein